MPRVIDGLFTPEVARMIGDNLAIEEHDNNCEHSFPLLPN